GMHSDYHKPTDDEEHINYYGVKAITDYVFRVVGDITALEKVEFVKTKADAGRKAPKYKVTLGVMPDYTDRGDGLHIDGVMENRPAAIAGIQSGDIITQIGDCKIKNVYEYMECLSKINPDDTLPVTFTREGKGQTVKVTF